MAQIKTKYICTTEGCGAGFATKMGVCHHCKKTGTIELNPNYNKSKTKQAIQATANRDYVKPKRFSEVKSEEYSRIGTGSSELDRVLGTDYYEIKGNHKTMISKDLYDREVKINKDKYLKKSGLVVGSVVLVAGDPGIGKSTLLLGICDKLSEENVVLYNSAEESMGQIKNRGDRIKLDNTDFYLSQRKVLEEIIQDIDEIKPDILIIDSIQTIVSNNIEGKAGKASQVEGIADQLNNIAKTKNISIFIVGHVTKNSEIAGPNTLKHAVDTTLSLEGDENGVYRILRTNKNRFGDIGEIGVFEMKEEGMVEVSDASNYFVREQSEETGCSLVSIMEGARPMLAEIQSLCIDTTFSNARRISTGIEYNKITMLAAVIEKKAGIFLSDKDIRLRRFQDKRPIRRLRDSSINRIIDNKYSNSRKNTYIG